MLNQGQPAYFVPQVGFPPLIHEMPDQHLDSYVHFSLTEHISDIRGYATRRHGGSQRHHSIVWGSALESVY